ncbi:MAG TPA: ABC transporter substrate-binding protein [Candidatus Limnocylindria bacterium]|nr:ABC transporter substrate-binding protein [Candidatus Limnocylindria bacterium]
MASVARNLQLPLLILSVFALLGATCTAMPSQRIGGTVSVIGSWSGPEEEAFRSVVAPFEEQTGITVEYRGTRDLDGVLWEGIARGRVPDVAGLPGPGHMADFAREGALQDLTQIIDIAQYKSDTVPAFVELGTIDGRLVGVFIKATLKGLVWYNPNIYTLEEPETWAELQALGLLAARGDTELWCVALESGATSGWPATDWIEDFLLRQSGPDVYDDWVAGTLPWTSAEVRSAFEAYGEVIGDSFGDAPTVLATNFIDGGRPLFTEPPGCLFHHQGTFMTEFFRSRAGARAGEYDFFPFPPIDERFANSVTGAGDLFGVFNDTPQARALMQYLLTPEAQTLWVERGGALSVNRRVTEYPDPISRRAAEVLSSADRFRFDASDLMPETMNAAFLQGVIDYTQEPQRLDEVLESLDVTRLRAYSGDVLTQPQGPP